MDKITDRFPPEDIETRVRFILTDAALIDAAIENWREGYWQDANDWQTPSDVIAAFAGYVEAYSEAWDADEPFLQEVRTIDDVEYEVVAVVTHLGGAWDIYQGDELLTTEDPLDGHPTDEDIRVVAGNWMDARYRRG